MIILPIEKLYGHIKVKSMPSVPTFRYIPIPELPESVTAPANERIRRFAIAMFMTDVSGQDDNPMPCSGTLVTIGNRPAILTARHVWAAARNREVLAVMLDGKVMRMMTASLQGIMAAGTERVDGINADVPDVGLIYILPAHAAQIRASGKAFYSIDNRRDSEEFRLTDNDGYFVVAGCPALLLRRPDPGHGMIGSILYSTNIDRRISSAGWDYIFVNLNLDGNPVVPENFQGVSGGGLWRVVVPIDAESGEPMPCDLRTGVMLAGVNFYQTGVPGRQLVAHGPESIYARLDGR